MADIKPTVCAPVSVPSEAAAVADIVREHFAPQLLTVGLVEEAQVLVLPKGLVAHSVKPMLDEYLSAPERRKGVAVLEDLSSFIAHAVRFSDADSALFAKPDPASPTLTSVLDYHRAGAEADPRFGTHRGVYRFPLSDEWKAWTGADGKLLDQRAFADWLEDHILEIADPAGAGESARVLAEALGASFASPSRLLELSRGLSIRVDSKVTNATKLSSGESQMQFVSQHTDESGAPIKVPAAFLVALPVFRGGALYQLAVRLRYRVTGGMIVWIFELHRADRIFEHAFRESCATAATDTSLPLYLGSPE